jgi:hypothetical protein
LIGEMRLAVVVIDTGLKRRIRPATMQNKPPKEFVHPLGDRAL